MGDMIDRDAVLAVIKQQVELWEKGTLVCGLDDLLHLYLPQAIAELPAVTVGVKPLVWHEGDEPDEWKSGPYDVWCELGKFQLYHWAIVMGEPHETADAAKAAAQADYEARILAALEPQPVLTANPVDDSQTPDPAVNDPVCTDCGGTGITYQTERRCACQGPDLSDPTAVHINMLRGTIAKPTVEQIIHLYGREAFRPMIDAAIAKALEKACAAVSEHADWPEDEHGRTEQVELFARVINAILAISPDVTQPAPHVNETPKTEHDAGNVLTPAPDAADSYPYDAIEQCERDLDGVEDEPVVNEKLRAMYAEYRRAIAEGRLLTDAALTPTPAPDAAAIREAVLRQLALLIAGMDAEAFLDFARDMDAALQTHKAAEAANRILALLTEGTIRKSQTVADDWECPISAEVCHKNCGSYGCGN